MKIILKQQSSIKLYTGELAYQALKNFVNKEFPNITSSTLYFEDSEADRILISSDSDLEVMKDLFDGKDYVKVYIQSETASEEKTQTLPEEKTQTLPEEKVQTESPEKIHHRHHFGKGKNRRSRSRSHHGHGKKHKGEKICNEIHTLISERIAEVVDQRLKALGLVKEEEAKVEKVGEVVHLNVECKGCFSKQIIGVRYKCLTCPDFSLCDSCEAKIDHEHDLLKMKKQVAVEKKDQGDFKKYLKFGRKFFKQLLRNDSSSERSQEKSKSKKRRRREGKDEAKVQRRMEKLSKFVKPNDNMHQFIEKTLDMPMKEAIELYAKENDIDMKEVNEKRVQFKSKKLGALFGKPQENYIVIARQHPELNFHEIAKLLKEQNMETYDGKSFGQMRARLRAEEKKSPRKEEEKVEVKVEEKVEQKPQETSNQEKSPKDLKKKQSEYREKGKIMKEMKELFGLEQQGIYPFIEANFALGKEAIIEKYIVEQLENSKQ